LVQAFFILITAISVFDLGYCDHVNKGIWFNHVLFHLDQLPDSVKNSAFWGEFQFWGYCFAIVALCQIMKVFPIGMCDLRKAGCLSGAVAAITLIVFTSGAIAACYQDYGFWTETLSSLVDYGWLPTILMSWGLMLGGLLALPFFVNVGKELRPAPCSIIAAGVACFSCIMLIFTGLLLPTDEPFNHGRFAYLFFLSMALAIGLFASTFRNYSPTGQFLRISGWILCPLVFILVLVAPSSLIPILQKFLAISYLLWLTGLGLMVCQKDYLSMKNDTGES